MSQAPPMPTIQGVLLAAGHGRRWQAAGGQDDKLLHRLPDGTPVVVAAARALQAALPGSLAVVRPGAHAVAEVLAACGMTLVWADPASTGMGENLARAIGRSREAAGWVVALGDMPGVSPDVVRAVSNALMQGHDLVAPFHQNRRGHPVGFGRTHQADLLALRGDTGARDLLAAQAHRLHRLNVDDEDILIDLDEPPSWHAR